VNTVLGLNPGLVEADLQVFFPVPLYEPRKCLKNIPRPLPHPIFSSTYIVYYDRAVRAGDLLATCFHAGFLLGLLFDPEDGGAMFLRSVA
jgi:hypothetical protein